LKVRFLSVLLWVLGLLPAEEITFKSTTQMVVVNVSATDRNGRPVEGLTTTDFKVLEDGKPQTLVSLDFQKLDGTVITPPIEPSGRLSAGRSNPRYKDRRLLVIFFDRASMPAAEMWRAQVAALKFVREQLTAHDVVAIMSYAERLELLQEFTNDRDRLTEVISGLTPQSEEASTSQEEAEFSIFNTDRKLGALEDAVRMLSSLPERKALVYFAAGAGSGIGIENQSQLRSTVNAAQSANVAVYAVDARGLTAQAPGGNASAAPSGGIGLFSGQAILGTQQLAGEDETLYRLSKETGGRALGNTNDLTLGLREAQRNLSSYYILGYYPSNPQSDGKYRRIKVEVASRLVASLDYRNGYFASKQFSHMTQADRERQLKDALALANPVTEIAVALEVEYFRTEKSRYVVVVAVKIPGIAIEFPEGGDETRLDFIAQVKNATGAVAATRRDSIEVKRTANLAYRTVHYDTTFLLSPGAYNLKFVTRENATGKMGTFETSFFVPDVTGDVGYLPISSVVLSNHREKTSARPGSHPLVDSNGRLIPSVTRVFRKDQQLYVYLEIYHSAAATIRVGFYRDRVKAFESAPVEASGGTVSLTLPLQTLEPGRYTCQVSVIAPAAQKFAFWRAPVVLLP
jgi:VWFA-related protein